MTTAKGNATDRAERSLLVSSVLALLLLALGLAVTTPAYATGTMSGAEKLRRLDIMLMVTGLRCRTTTDDFQADYGRFTTRHIQILNQANDQLLTEMSTRYGSRRDAQRALDRFSTTMANAYGQGHPWLSCHELKQVTRNLIDVEGRATLEEAADQLLAASGSTQLAYGQP